MASNFTVRIADRHAVRVVACEQYVAQESQGRWVLSLYDAPGPVAHLAPVETLALDEGVRAFVMNAAGATVDKLPREMPGVIRRAR